jgi:HlyD family secretion protein
MNKDAGGFEQAIGENIHAALELDSAGKGRRGRRWIKWSLIILALAAVGGWLSWTLLGSTQQVTYRTAEAALGDLVIEVNATGTLNPQTTVDVSSEMSGVIREVPVEENQQVHTNDVLARLDTVSLSAQVERVEAQVVSAAAQVENATVSLRDATDALTRAETLAKRSLISTQDVETARSTRDKAAATLSISRAAEAVARADLKIQQAALEKSVIRSPIDGIVLTRSADPGQTVAASLSAPILFVIAEDLASMKLEAAIGQLAIDQRATFTVDAWPDQTFEARVRDIAYASTKTDNVVTYAATFNVDNARLLLRPGMTATVAVVVREAKGVVTVPNEAFRFTPPATTSNSGGFSLLRLFMPRFPQNGTKKPEIAADGTRTLYVLENGVPVAVKVKAGSSDGERTEIVSGLEAGKEVVLATVSASK